MPPLNGPHYSHVRIKTSPDKYQRDEMAAFSMGCRLCPTIGMSCARGIVFSLLHLGTRAGMIDRRAGQWEERGAWLGLRRARAACARPGGYKGGTRTMQVGSCHLTTDQLTIYTDAEYLHINTGGTIYISKHNQPSNREREKRICSPCLLQR